MAAQGTTQPTQEQLTAYSANVLATVRLALGLDKFGTGKAFSPQMLEETNRALEAQTKKSGANLAKDLAAGVVKNSTLAPKNTPEIPMTEAQMKTILTDLPEAGKFLTAVAVAPAAKPAATAQAGAPDAGVKQAETLLSSFGINVGKVDGVRDADFDKAVKDLKDLVRAVAPNVQISAGAGLNANDLKALEKGLADFAGSTNFRDLQLVRKGQTPPIDPKLVARTNDPSLSVLDKLSAEKDLKAAQLEMKGFAYLLSDEKTEAGRLKLALDLKAKTDPALKAALEKVPAAVLDKLPQILDVVGNAQSRTSLVAGLNAAYTKPAATAVAASPSAKPGATTTSGAANAPAAVAPSAQPAAANPAPAAEPASSSPAGAGGDTPEKVQAASELLERIMVDKINPMLDKFQGGFKFAGINPSDLLPVLTEADVGGEFGEKSQRMAATMVMGLKTMAGIQPPDGTYNEQIGKQLKMAILTDDKMQMVRDALGVDKMSKADAAALLEDKDKLKKQALDFYMLFDSVDTLSRAKKLDEKGLAKSITKQNMMLDGLSTFLDKSEWGQKTKAWLKDFFTNSKIGQMIGSVLSLFGFNVGRLWGDKNDAAGIERAKPTLEGIYNGYIESAQKELGPTAQFKDVMAKTRENIMNDLNNNVKFELGMKMIFGNADKDKIKESIDKALVEAGKQPNAEAAKKVFVDSLVEMGKQYRNGQEIDLDKALTLIGEAKGTVEAAKTNPELKDLIGNTPVPAPAPVTSQPSAAPVPSGATTTSGAQNAPASVLPANNGGAKPVSGMPADAAANKIEAGQKDLHFVYDRDPKDYNQKLIPSNGRVHDVLSVISGNSDALKMSLDMGMIKDKSGAVIDKATKPACAILEELSIRAHVAKQLRDGGTVDLAKIDRKMDSAKDVAVIASYLKESGVSDADITKFRKAADALLADRTMDKAFVNTPQIKLVQVEKIVQEQQAARDPNAVKVDPRDAALYEMYKDKNKDSGPHCYPLVFLGRVAEDGRTVISLEQDRKNGVDVKMDKDGNPDGYKVFVGVVDNNRDADKTNDVFKVIEAKDFVKNGLKTSVGDPAYDALRKNYAWSDTQGGGQENRATIDNHIRSQTCLNMPSHQVEFSSQPITPVDARPEGERTPVTVPKAVFEPVVSVERPLPKRYEDLAKEPFRISQVEAETLEGGTLNLNAKYKEIQDSVRTATRNGQSMTWSALPAFKEGPYMITPLENKADREKLGGDMVVSRMINGEMVHSVLDSKKDGIIHPNEYKGSVSGKDYFAEVGSARDTAQRIGGKNVRIGLDEFLDTNVGNASHSGYSDGMGTSFVMMEILSKKAGNYIADNAFDRLYGTDKLKRDAISLAVSGDSKGAQEIAQKVPKMMEEYDTQRMQRGYERVQTENKLLSGGSVASRDFGQASGSGGSDKITVAAAENFTDMGVTSEDDVGGYIPSQSRKGMSYGATP